MEKEARAKRQENELVFSRIVSNEAAKMRKKQRSNIP
jgi:hypothetical protein